MSKEPVKSPASITPLPWSLNFFAMGSLFLAALCFSIVAYCCSKPPLNHDPYNVPWFTEYFPDLLFLKPRFEFFHSRQFFLSGGIPYLYPAPNSVVYEAFYLLSGQHPVAWFLGLAAAAYSVAGLLYLRALSRRGVPLLQGAAFTGFTLLCCYPVWFELKQANIEIFTWVLISSGLALFLSGRSYWAAACFCIAGSMKLYPLILLGLLLQRRQYRQIVVGLFVFISVTALSTWLLCPDFVFSWRHVGAGVDQFREQYMLRYRYESMMDHSLFATAKAYWQPLPNPMTLGKVLNVYIAGFAVSGAILWFWRIRRQPVFNQILALTTALVLFPPTSFEYTLQHLLAPLALFTLLLVDASRRGQTVKWSGAYLISFFCLLAPIPELIHDRARLDGPVKSVVLLFLFILSLLKSVSMGLSVQDEAARPVAVVGTADLGPDVA